jgi:hypothetical protein
MVQGQGDVHLWTPNNTLAQKWWFQDAGDGYFFIASAVNNGGSCLDVFGGMENAKSGGVVQLWKKNGTDAQKWKLVPVQNRIWGGVVTAYNIVPKLNENVCLDAFGNGMTEGTDVHLYTANGTGAQLFQLFADFQGAWSVINTNSMLCLDVNGAFIQS